MKSIPSFRAPPKWLRVSKYLLPVDLPTLFRWRTPSPRIQVSVAQLAVDHPESVTLHTSGAAETVPEFHFVCHTSGEREVRSMPTRFAPPAYVAELKNGLSYGRHCCVIGPAGKAIRETGFNLDGKVVAIGVSISPLRPQYWRKRLQGDVTSQPWLPAKQRIEGRVAVLNTRFSHNFYHWLIDILPRLVPLRRAGIEADYYLVDCLSQFQQGVLAALGIQRAQLIQPHSQLLLEAERLLVPSLPSPACLREFGPMLAAGLGIDQPVTRKRRIFISRRKTGTRTLANETELVALLQSHNFETHSMEDYPLAQQARYFREAEIIVATHGAGLANLVFAQPGTQVIEIVPAGRRNFACYPRKSCTFGLHHQLLFAARARHKQVIRVSLDDVAAALSDAERAIYRAASA